MKKLVSMILVFGFASSLFAVTGDVQAQSAGKFGVVDMQAVILNVSEGKAARSTLESEIKAKEKEFLAEKKELDKLNEDWKKQASILSESARAKKQQEFQQRFMALRNSEMTFQQEIKRKEAKATQSIALKVAKIVEGIAKNQKLQGVFEANTAGLLYLKDPVNLTKLVISSYEKDHGKGAVASKKGKK